MPPTGGIAQASTILDRSPISWKRTMRSGYKNTLAKRLYL
jgi:hypothetical protein